MPFPDEVHLVQVEVEPYQRRWETEGRQLVDHLRYLVPSAAAVEHIGSTSIPGMASKDGLDLMSCVENLGTTHVEERMTAAGHRRRPEPWNASEPASGRWWPKMVFAPPVGSRQVNIHARDAGSATARLPDWLRCFEITCEPAAHQPSPVRR